MKMITITIMVTASSTSLVFQGLREYGNNRNNYIVRPHVFSKLQYVDCGGRQDSDGASYPSSCKEAPTQLKIHVQKHIQTHIQIRIQILIQIHMQIHIQIHKQIHMQIQSHSFFSSCKQAFRKASNLQ